MASSKYWVWLATRRAIRPVDRLQLLHHYGSAEAVYQAQEQELQARFPLLEPGMRSLCDKDLRGSEAILADCDRKGIRILCYSDADFPERLKQIPEPPILLYIRGTWRAIDELLAIGIVGPRQSSSYGIRAAMEFSTELAKNGATIVSGIAQGVDVTALHYALNAGGYAISVLANGVDVVYPSSSAPVYEDMAARGALVSEYPPGTKALSGHFPVRNRLIAGLSLGVLVTEAGARSGSLITARYAVEQNRDCFAVPGDIFTSSCVGSNRLLRDGLAMAVTSPQDILQEYQHLYPHLRRESPEKPSVALPEILARETNSQKTVDNRAQIHYISLTEALETYALSEEQQTILKCLDTQTLTLDELVEQSGLPVLQVTNTLTYLELEEYVIQTTGKRYYATLGIR